MERTYLECDACGRRYEGSTYCDAINHWTGVVFAPCRVEFVGSNNLEKIDLCAPCAYRIRAALQEVLREIEEEENKK